MNLLTKLARVLWISEYRSALLRTRVAASTEHDRILAGLALDTVVDIGANRGQFALCMRRLYPRAQIFSFEPLARPAAVYRETFRNDDRARLFATAISSASGSALMHVSRWDGSSSLLPFAAAQRENFPFTGEAGQETVTTARLVDCLDGTEIRGTALLKLDVQGFELTALEGCQELLARFQYAYVEASFVELYVGQALASDVIAHLRAHRLRLACVANLARGRSRRPIQADFLFARDQQRDAAA